MPVHYDPGGGGPPAVTSFSDTLIGADRPFYIGNQYYLVGMADSGVAPVEWAAQLNIGGTGLTYGNGGGTNDNTMFANAYPSAIDYGATVAKSLSAGLFAQFKIVSKTIAGVNSSAGVFLFGNPGVNPCYFLQVHSQAADTPLFRKENAGSTNLVANMFNNAAGDLIRMEARIIGAAVQIKTFQNGVLQNTFLDNSGSAIVQGGAFGLAFSGVFTGQWTMSNFAGGNL